LPLLLHLQTQYKKVHSLKYKDHHYFTFDDLEEITAAFKHLASDNKIIVTTEKDAARLMLLKEKILANELPFFAQAIGIEILFDEKNKFDQIIQQYIETIIPPYVEMNEDSNVLSDENQVF
jgi:tetraacyldisaccharide 4'-kinase